MTFSWVATGFFLVAGASQAHVSNEAAAIVDVFCAVVTMLAPFVLRRSGRVAMVTHAVLALVFSGVLSLAVLVRGPGLSGATILMMVTPLFATLVLGARGGLVWLCISLSMSLTVGVLGQAGLISDHLSGEVKLINDHFVLIVFTLVLFAIANVFENRKDEALRHISELEAKRRLAELGQARAHAAAQLAQAEQFASLGRIAGAAAHEINNPLAYVMSNLEYVATSLPGADEELRSALRDAQEGAQRIHRIVTNMSTIVRSENEPLTFVSVTDALTIAINLAEPHTSTRAKVTTRFEKVPKVHANETRLTQVFLSLLLNAGQAIPAGRAGEHEIVVELRLKEGQVQVEISDTGTHLITRGLGEGESLAVILGEAVVRGFGGTLCLESAAQRTVARLTLPAASEFRDGSLRTR